MKKKEYGTVWYGTQKIPVSGTVPGAYPGGMHRMHVHPPPCASPPPPRPFASPPAWKAGYEKRWGSGQQEKNASLFTET